MIKNKTGHGTWYHQPVVWLGALIILGSLAGCLGLIALSRRYADEPVPDAGPSLFRMPATRPAAALDSPRREQ